MKDKKHLGFRPIYHWTDASIRVHAFYCVLALRLCCILNTEIEQLGHKMSINLMLDMLSEVQQVITVFANEINKSSLSGLNGEVKQIVEKINLTQHQLKL